MIKAGFIGAGDIAYLQEGVSSSYRTRRLWNRTRSKAEEKAELFGTRVFDGGRGDRNSRRRVYPHQHGNPSFLCHAGHRSRQAILVEKPTAVTIAEIEEIKEAANGKGVGSLPYTIISTNPPSCGPKI